MTDFYRQIVLNTPVRSEDPQKGVRQFYRGVFRHTSDKPSVKKRCRCLFQGSLPVFNMYFDTFVVTFMIFLSKIELVSVSRHRHDNGRFGDVARRLISINSIRLIKFHKVDSLNGYLIYS
ncbi:hypothetical protein NPIL_690701 [Nephila pilipes]|uniref:Uncharacterized protein n=1 Tax=Nephila pilipes TaxID=299642 RepID=A0A8X6QYR2_NEPPI|nr:hypothetical protein NPIL_690701 [Nephila pilipes]